MIQWLPVIHGLHYLSYIAKNLLRYTIMIQWLPVIHGLHYLSCIAKNLLRYTIMIHWLPVIHGLHCLSCIAKNLSAMKDNLRKDRDPIFNKIIKFSNSIQSHILEIGQCYSVTCSYTVCHSQSFCPLTKIHSEICLEVEKVPFLHFNTFLLSRQALVKNCNYHCLTEF